MTAHNCKASKWLHSDSPPGLSGSRHEADASVSRSLSVEMRLRLPFSEIEASQLFVVWPGVLGAT